jgi:AbrB family looped-hinge helix DNA binding protein
MAHKVGAKGQVVIAKEIRDQLGIEPGALTIQRVVGDHVEIRFVPGRHKRSLFGVLAPYVHTSIPEEEWHEAKERAWAEAAREKMEGLDE